MKFKLGDKVKVRQDLSRHILYTSHGNYFDEELNCVSVMEQYRGDVCTVTQVFPDNGMYHLDVSSWIYWCDEMLEPLKRNKYKIKGV